MITALSNSYNWYPSLFNTSPTQPQESTNLFDMTSVDQDVTQNAAEQSLNLPSQTNTYDLLNNISPTSTFSGITNLDQYSLNTYLLNSNPYIGQVNQALQAYNSNQNYTMYSLASQYDQTI